MKQFGNYIVTKINQKDRDYVVIDLDTDKEIIKFQSEETAAEYARLKHQNDVSVQDDE